VKPELVDRTPDNWRPCCIICVTWACTDGCGNFHRNYALRSELQICPKCGAIGGTSYVVRHYWRNPNGHHKPRRQVPYPVLKLGGTMESHDAEYREGLTEEDAWLESNRRLDCNMDSVEEKAQPKSGYPYKDGDVLVLGPGVIFHPEDEVISFNGRNYSAPPPPDKASMLADEADHQQKYLRREAMDWAVRLSAAGDDNDTITGRAQALYNWLTAK
jgi:hypothetical protein